MTYKLLLSTDDYPARMKKLRRVVKQTGGKITGTDLSEDSRYEIINVEEEDKNHGNSKMPAVRVRMDAPDRQPEMLPDVQAIPEKRSAEKSKPEKIKTLNVTGEKGNHRTNQYRVVKKIKGCPHNVGSRITLHQGNRNQLLYHVWRTIIEVPEVCVSLERS